MATEARCDLAVWDVSGDLLDGLRTELTGKISHKGPKLSVWTGERNGQRLALGRPQRVIAAHAPKLAEAVQALIAAHRPRLLVVIGPAAAAVTAFPLDQVVVAEQVFATSGVAEFPRRLDELAIPSSPVGDGPIDSEGAVAQITTDWAMSAAEAIIELGIEAILLAVVTEAVDESTDTIKPPASRPATISRNAGAFVGKLLAGKFEFADKKSGPQQAAVHAIDSVLRSLA